MDVSEIMTGAREALTGKRVYGEPIERDGVTIIPAAAVIGGGGGGGDANGSGGGFGGFARPVGAYVIRDGEVRWEPAFDLTWIVLGSFKIFTLLLKIVAVRRKRRKR